jgi:single-strand DNA-binding protein
MSDLNLVILIGNAGDDPKVYFTPTGVKIVTVRIATNRYYRAKDAAELTKATEWHQIKLFGQLADVAEKYVTKGKQVRISGESRTRSYVKDGAPPEDRRYVTEVYATELQLLGGGASKDEDVAARSNNSPTGEPDPGEIGDVPF